MKKIFGVVLALLVPVIAFAMPNSFTFKNHSSADGSKNVVKVCSVMVGTISNSTAFNADSIINYSLTANGGVGSVTIVNGKDYKVSCFVSSTPEVAATVQVYFNSATTNLFPMSTLLLGKN